ncbi:hypothetical protein DFH07DRAFT_969025 [Mycena maculata]|uniref:Uncharacterized protein n=1 Tax=Mycena maculata TaxID=230809 RepID=A0AAD7HYB2_9AGAR|nr:hypothetical protein DFH07DRAFT_969025 [Mycena maculata]
MLSVSSRFSATTDFPDHNACFGDPTYINNSTVCQIPSATMINFLNISDPNSYLATYCNNPLVDSCAFGYCPNPDMASPAVPYSVSTILILYSLEDVELSIFAQLLNGYSLIMAAIIAISKHTLTKMHSIIALTLATSPLSIYLLIYVFRSFFRRHTHLNGVFRKGKYLNRAIVILMFPLWVSVLAFTTLPTSVWPFNKQHVIHKFQILGPVHCYMPSYVLYLKTVVDNSVVSIFFIPFIIFFVVFPKISVIIVALILIMWGIAIFFRHHHCPPYFIWIFNIEVGPQVLSKRESFSVMYGQLLAIFVTVPPFIIQLCLLLQRVPCWFLDLAWVHLVTCRRMKPYLTKRPSEGPSEIPMHEPEAATGVFEQKSGSAASLHPSSDSSSSPAHSSFRAMDAFTTTTIPSRTEETVLPPVNDDSGTGSSGSCVVCKEDTSLPPVNNDSGTGSSGSCVIA